MKPNNSLSRWQGPKNIVIPNGIDDSVFKTFTKNKNKRKKNKLARKSRKLNRIK